MKKVTTNDIKDIKVSPSINDIRKKYGLPPVELDSDAKVTIEGRDIYVDGKLIGSKG